MSMVAVAQKGETRARLAAQLSASLPSDQIALNDIDEDDPVIISEAALADIKSVRIPTSNPNSTLGFHSQILAAIDERLGAPYRWGATGPSAYDCSGFVWSIYQSVGIDFERANARTLWTRFTAPTEAEKYQFGTLVFFNNLAHVGIVVDEHGFYHASRHHGVVYSPFNDYWMERLDGFRKVTAAAAQPTD
jgi:peptidoglycan endopeptidase LytE